MLSKGPDDIMSPKHFLEWTIFFNSNKSMDTCSSKRYSKKYSLSGLRTCI